MDLTIAHWLYLLGTLCIIATMLFRRNVVVPAVIGTFLVGWLATDSFITGLQAVFKASLIAAVELFDIFLIIAVMTALLHALKDIEADRQMITPFQKVMRNGHLSFWILVFVTYGISLFFWPTPAVPLVGAILIPVAIRAGLPPIGAAVAIALAGQGMALSSDYVIQIAPSLSAASAQVSASAVADKAFILSIITGITALVIAYLMLRKSITDPSDQNLVKWQNQGEGQDGGQRQTVMQNKALARSKYGKFFALTVPIIFAAVVIYMLFVKFALDAPIQGGDGAALIGGIAFLLVIAASMTRGLKSSLEKVSQHVIEGLLFAFKAMGVVLPIAGFFFLGNGETASQILSMGEAPSFLFELVQAGEHYIPGNVLLTAFGILLIGMITGLDGSGFSGLPLTGALSGPLGYTVGIDPATLAAIGQMGAIWVGGGTLIAWSSLVAVAGFAKVPVLELVRKNFIPVMIGLMLSTLVAVLFL